ncbi:carrier superfamily protein [Cystoisospora suis]|uniref:Carrier superfamily protein n=1 Tax=Cystoisospora suis TaxID=483139 RepID=A0A2C6KSD1_9APIC|nr:carrier superfamily protein [Cystoisospora suis]
MDPAVTQVSADTSQFITAWASPPATRATVSTRPAAAEAGLQAPSSGAAPPSGASTVGGVGKRVFQCPIHGGESSNVYSSGGGQGPMGETDDNRNAKGRGRDRTVEDRSVERDLDWEEWRGDWPLALHAAAGSVAGLMEHLTMYPIDTLKTRIQALADVAGTEPDVVYKSSGRPFRRLGAESSATVLGGRSSVVSPAGHPTAQNPLCHSCPLHGHYIRPCPLAAVAPGRLSTESSLHSFRSTFSPASVASSPRGPGSTPPATLPLAETRSEKADIPPSGQARSSKARESFLGRLPGSVETRGEAVRHCLKTGVRSPGTSATLLVPRLHASSWRRAGGPTNTWSAFNAVAPTRGSASRRSSPRLNRVSSAHFSGAGVPVPLKRVSGVLPTSCSSPHPLPFHRRGAAATEALAEPLPAARVGSGPAPALVSRGRLVAGHSQRAFSVALLAQALERDLAPGSPFGHRFHGFRSHFFQTGLSSPCLVALSSDQTGGFRRPVRCSLRPVSSEGGLGVLYHSGLMGTLKGSPHRACGSEAICRAYRCTSTTFSHLDNSTVGSRSTIAGRTSLLAAAQSLYREGGVSRFYRGASAVASGCIPAHALYFLSYEGTKEFFLERREKVGMLACDGAGGASSRLRRREESVTAPRDPPGQNGMVSGDDSASVTQQRTSQLSGTPGGSILQGSDSCDVRSNLTSHGRFSVSGPEGSGSAESPIRAEEAQLSPVESLICGGAATVTHDVVLTPMDVIKQRLQLGCYRSPLDCLRTVVQQEGITALCRSLPATMLLNLPYGATLVCMNEWLKQFLHRPRHSLSATESRNGLPLYFFCAAVSGGVAGLISNPLDVIKTRLQTQDCFLQRQEAIARELTVQPSLSNRPHVVKGHFFPRVSRKYTSIADAVRTILREEGARGFWKGTSTRIALSAPATGICWGSYESVKYLWRRLYADEEFAC